MKVITINEENHGYIGIAKDYYSAITFLINNRWLTANDDMWDQKKNWVPIKEMLGEGWVEQIYSWDIEKFNEFFGAGAIILTEEKVIEYPQEI